MNETIKLILSLSLSGSILALCMFLLKPLIKHRLPKSIQYYLWVIVLLRLVIPFSFEGSAMNAVFYGDHLPKAKTSIEISPQAPIKPIESPENNSVHVPSSLSVQQNAANGVYNGDTDHSRYFTDLIGKYILYIWILGAAISLAVNVMGYIRFAKHLRQTNRPAGEKERAVLSTLLGGRKKVKLMCNRFVTTPMLVGILRPYIIIPDTDFTEKQLKNILRHEIVHLKRFDIAVKWFTMIATSIHWFNPLMIWVKREVNHACELACDEAVIKNLDPADKQAYGDTLISVVAEHKYPVGVLQATLCEEKKSLKERLIAIMKHNKKSGLVIVLSIVLLGLVTGGALYLGAGVGDGGAVPPHLYISAEEESTKEALTGTYDWRYNNDITVADSEHPKDFIYSIDNRVSVAAKQQLVLSTQKFKKDRNYDFNIKQISVYKDGRQIEFDMVEPSFLNHALYIQAPPEPGDYIYCVELNFKDRGTVSYGFVVKVEAMKYFLGEIAKHKTPYVGNNSKVAAVAGNLPVPDVYFKQQYISLKTKEEPYGLTIYYEPASGTETTGAWLMDANRSVIEKNAAMNALVVFCMIDNLNEVNFAFRDSQSEGRLDESKYGTVFTFQRASYEKEYGDLSVLGKDLNLLQEILAGKKFAREGVELYIWRKPELTGNDDLYYTLLDGNQQSRSENEIYNLDIASSDLTLIKKELSRYTSGVHVSVRHSMEMGKESLTGILDELSGAIENGSVSVGGRDFEKELLKETAVPEFTDAEIASARAVVEEYFRAVAAKEDKAILKTLTPMHNQPNAVLYDAETRTLLTVHYDVNDPMRESYVTSGRGNVNGIKKENVIVFRVSFNVKYPKGASGSFEEGDYTNWSMTLIREDKTSPWLIDDQGY